MSGEETLHSTRNKLDGIPVYHIVSLCYGFMHL